MSDERVNITQLRAAGKSTLEVAKDLHRDPRTINIYHMTARSFEKLKIDHRQEDYNPWHQTFEGFNG